MEDQVGEANKGETASLLATPTESYANLLGLGATGLCLDVIPVLS